MEYGLTASILNGLTNNNASKIHLTLDTQARASYKVSFEEPHAEIFELPMMM